MKLKYLYLLIIFLVIIFFLTKVLSIENNQLINKPGIYRLNSDLSLKNGFYINSSDVVLDCQGHTIKNTKGTINNENCGICICYHPYLKRKNITIINCRIEGFYYGIKIFGYYDVVENESTLENIFLINNYFGLFSRGKHQLKLVNVTANNNNNTGIILENSGYNKLVNITTINNKKYGIKIDRGFKTDMRNYIISISNNFLNNIVSNNNSWSGISISYSPGTILNNIITKNNGWSGIEIINSNKTKIINILSENNKEEQIYIYDSINVSIISSSSTPQ